MAIFQYLSETIQQKGENWNLSFQNWPSSVFFICGGRTTGSLITWFLDQINLFCQQSRNPDTKSVEFLFSLNQPNFTNKRLKFTLTDLFPTNWLTRQTRLKLIWHSSWARFTGQLYKLLQGNSKSEKVGSPRGLGGTRENGKFSNRNKGTKGKTQETREHEIHWGTREQSPFSRKNTNTNKMVEHIVNF